MVIHQMRDGLVTSGQFPELLTAEQVSGLLGVSAATVNRWAAIREQTGQQIGPPCYSLSDRRAAMGRSRSAQVATTGASLMAGSTPRGIRKRCTSGPAALPSQVPGAECRIVSAGSKRRRHSRRCGKRGPSRQSATERRPTGGRRFDPRLGRVTLTRIWEQFAASKQPAVSPKTWSGYTQHWDLRIRPRFGHLPVDEITRKDIQQFVDDLTVGPWAKLSTLRLLRSVLELAREDGRIHANPARGCSAGRLPARDRHRYLTATEVAALRVGLRRPGRHRDDPGVHGPPMVRTGRPARR